MYRYHVVGRGFSDVGYNFAIDHRGTVYEGRWARHYAPGERHDGEDGGGFGVVGAHALGVNAGSCGIVLIGDFTKGKPTSAALGSLIQLISWKASLHQVDPLHAEEYISIFGLHRSFPNIAGHRQTGQTVCPGPMLFKQLPWIRDQVAARTGRFPAVTIDMSKALRWTDLTALPASFVPSTETAAAARPAAAAPAGSKLTGYRILTSDGRVVTLGKAAKLGSPRDMGLGAVSAIAGVPGRNAYLTAGSSGRVVGFGGAASGTPKSAVPTADMATTPSGQGYWVLSSSGGVYAFGSAKHYGSLSRSGVGSAGVKIRSTPSGKGYWILAANGRIYPFGDAAEALGAVVGLRGRLLADAVGRGLLGAADGRPGRGLRRRRPLRRHPQPQDEVDEAGRRHRRHAERSGLRDRGPRRRGVQLRQLTVPRQPGRQPAPDRRHGPGLRLTDRRTGRPGPTARSLDAGDGADDRLREEQAVLEARLPRQPAVAVGPGQLHDAELGSPLCQSSAAANSSA